MALVKVDRLVDYLKHNYAKSKDAWEKMVEGAYNIMEVKKGEDAPEWFQKFAFEGEPKDEDPRKSTQMYNFEKASTRADATGIIEDLLESDMTRMFVTPDDDTYRGAMFAKRNSEGIQEIKYGDDVRKALDETTHILTIFSLKTKGGKRSGQLIMPMLYAEFAMHDEFGTFTP